MHVFGIVGEVLEAACGAFMHDIYTVKPRGKLHGLNFEVSMTDYVVCILN